MNTAQTVANEFSNDGSVFERQRDGLTIMEACLRRHGEISYKNGDNDLIPDRWVFTFTDGSYITGNSNGWFTDCDFDSGEDDLTDWDMMPGK